MIERRLPIGLFLAVLMIGAALPSRPAHATDFWQAKTSGGFVTLRYGPPDEREKPVFLLSCLNGVGIAVLSVYTDFPENQPGDAITINFSAGGQTAPVAGETAAENVRRAGERTAPSAAAWIAANVPPGSRIALESYGPYINPAAFDLQVFEQIIDNSPNWYVEQGFDYLVLSQGRYGRYFLDPERYAKEVAGYESFFASFDRVKTFSSERAEIRIYAIHND